MQKVMFRIEKNKYGFHIKPGNRTNKHRGMSAMTHCFADIIKANEKELIEEQHICISNYQTQVVNVVGMGSVVAC